MVRAAGRLGHTDRAAHAAGERMHKRLHGSAVQDSEKRLCLDDIPVFIEGVNLVLQGCESQVSVGAGGWHQVHPQLWALGMVLALWLLF